MMKVAVFHWGQISIHTFYLVKQLHAEGFAVNLYLYTPSFANKSPLLIRLLKELYELVSVYELPCTPFEAKIIKLNRLTKLANLRTPMLCVNPLLPAKTRRLFAAAEYTSIITVAQSSLFWLYKTDPAALKKTIHYTLEIEKTTDPVIPKNCCLYNLVLEEQKLLPAVEALLVQDKDRADSLLADLKPEVKRIYLPVSVPGDVIETKNKYLHEKLNIPSSKKIVLYFGAIYRERYIEEMIEVFEKMGNEEFVLVLHGSGEFSHLVSKPERVFASNEMVPFHELHKVISSAYIAMAFYDNSWDNNRLTAFSSEKIARYLQAGVPFMAFSNENYLRLQASHHCCELVNNFSEIPAALQTINNNYDHYRTSAFGAFNSFFKIENSIQPLVKHLKQKHQQPAPVSVEDEET